MLMKSDLEQMSQDEKLMSMHALWEDLAREDVGITSPDWHQAALQEADAGLAVRPGEDSRLGLCEGGAPTQGFMIKIRILDSAMQDLDRGRKFYEGQ